MKRISNIILLLGLIFLLGCKDGKSVSFTEDEIYVGSNGGTFIVSICADCNWTIKSSSNSVNINKSSGFGNSEIHVNIIANTAYDEVTYTLTITGEDGISSDLLIIRQKSNIGIIADSKIQVSCEGGEIVVPIKTNDKNVRVWMSPGWIISQSSRSLEDQTFTFYIEPNKTGRIRTGTVEFKGDKGFKGLLIEQDSYSPDSVITNPEDNYFSGDYIYIPYTIVPEYADFSKLKIKAPEEYDAKISKGYISLKMADFGQYVYTISSQETDYVTDTLLFEPYSVLKYPDRKKYYTGQTAKLELEYESNNYLFSSSNQNVIKISANGDMEMISEGESEISVTIPGTNFKESVQIEVSDVAITAWRNFDYNGIEGYVIEVIALIEGLNITSYKVVTTDYNRRPPKTQCLKEGELLPGNNIFKYHIHALCMFQNYEDMKIGLENIKVEFIGLVNGKEVTKSASLLYKKPDWIEKQD